MKNLIYVIILTINIHVIFAQKNSIDLSYEKKIEYNASVVYKQKLNSGSVFKKVVIDGFDSKIPFYLIQSSDTINNQYVILQHGLGGTKDNWMYARSELTKNFKQIKDSLSNLGFNLIIPDAKYHGERSYESNFTPPALLIKPTKLTYAQNIFITTARDIRIIMDFIEQENPRKKVSFSYIGYSGGAVTGILLNSVEKRFQGVVVCVPAFDAYKASKEIFGWKDEEASKKLDYISPKNYSEFQKAPLCLLVGKEDKYYTVKEAEIFFENISNPNKELKFFNSGHYLPDAYIHDAINWIMTHKK